MVLALAQTSRPIVTWPNAIAGLVLVIWLIPIKLYRLPAGLPFNLEIYRIAVGVLVLAFIFGVLSGRLPADRGGPRQGNRGARGRRARLADR